MISSNIKFCMVAVISIYLAGCATTVLDDTNTASNPTGEVKINTSDARKFEEAAEFLMDASIALDIFKFVGSLH